MTDKIFRKMQLSISNITFSLKESTVLPQTSHGSWEEILSEGFIYKIFFNDTIEIQSENYTDKRQSKAKQIIERTEGHLRTRQTGIVAQEGCSVVGVRG